MPKENLLLIGVGFVVILIGCICMIGGGSTDGVSYNPEIFSSMRITVAPIILVIGFFFEIVAIVWLRGGKENEAEAVVEKGVSTYDDNRRSDMDNVGGKKKSSFRKARKSRLIVPKNKGGDNRKWMRYRLLSWV